MKGQTLFALSILVTVCFVNLGGAADLEVTPVEDFDAAGEPGGPFAPSSKDYQLKNLASVPLMWGGDKTAGWLSLNPEWGQLEPNEAVSVTVSVTSEANSLEEGIHSGTLIFTDLTNGVEYTRAVSLRVAYPGSIWYEPNSFDVNVKEGCRLAEAMTIGNSRPVDVNFVIRSRVAQVSAQSALASDDISMSEQKTIPSAPRDPDFSIPADAVYKPGRLIVRFAPNEKGKQRSTAEKSQILSSLGGAIVKRNYGLVPGLSLVQLPAPMAVENAVRAFNKANGILYAQPDYQVQALSTLPNDSRFAELWGLHNTGQNSGTPDADIDAPEAWDIATGSREVVAAVIDTGVDYTHADLAPNMWVNELEFYGETGFDDDGNEYVDDIYGYDFCNYDSDPMDDHTFIYHGTHCAGTVGGVGNNAQGVAGVCWNVRIMALKFLDSSGFGWESDAVAAIEYSVLMGAHLSSNSWGGSFYNQGLKDAIDAAGAAGMLFVAAAGNDNANTDERAHYPSNYSSPCIISVMATDRNDNKSGFSNYGLATVDLGAPGSEILSCKRGNAYQYLSGTSMATPHVAGACALLLSVNPMLTGGEVKNMLLQTVDPTLPGLCVSGGRLNLYNAILQARAPWIDIEPEQGTIPGGDSDQVSVDFQAIRMTPGTYEADIIILSSDPFNPTSIVPVEMTVVPDDLTVTPDEDFSPTGIKGGPFEPDCLTYTLTNRGDYAVNWTTWGPPDWLIVDPNAGVLDPCRAVDVNVCISPDADLFEPNLYRHTLTFENTDSNSIKPRLVTLAVRPPDSFAESFDEADNDLSFRSLTLRPEGSVTYYQACRNRITQFPTDPNGGTYVGLWDDDFVEVTLGEGERVLFYGQWYDRFYVGSNGYVTFGQGDTEYDATLENHFSIRRISGLFADLDPPDDECISYKQLEDRVAVTFENVPLYPYKPGTSMNSFQIEMFFVDGTIRITWLELAASACVAGLSKGEGLPRVLFAESNLSEYLPCRPVCDFDEDYSVTFGDFAVLADYWQYGDCNIPYWCGGSDVDFSGRTDVNDLVIFAESWLDVDDWWLQPIAQWKFDEGQGEIAYDSVGSSHGALMGDPNWVAGLIDGALSFDGAEDYVKVPDSRHVNFGPGSSMTLSVWVSYTTSEPVRIEQKYDPDSENGYAILANTEDVNVGTISLRTWSASKAKKVYYDGDYNDGEWHLVVGVRDQSMDRMYLYVDGAKRDEVAENKRDLRNTGDLHIGTGWNADGYFFEGNIDDGRIYDRTLSLEEIGQLYQEPSE